MRQAADAAPSFLYLPDLAERAAEFTLDGDEVRYLAKVVRARDGEHVTASDGAGLLASLVVERSRPEVRLRVLERRSVAAPAGAHLLCGAPEGERGDWLVEKLAELGVSELVPVETERVRWPGGPRVERWERLAVAALRQSRSAWRMRLSAPIALAEAVEALPPGTRWLADPGGSEGASLELGVGPVAGAIGPSSGFSDGERKSLLENGFMAVRLAATRLRTETAALALAALWASRRAGGQPRRESGTP
jgi:16S rRNA (uracil1498-N3)-methyltransferase